VTTINLLVQSRQQGTWTILDVKGEIDLSTAPRLRERIVELVEGGSYNIVVNLSDVPFMDSTGLGVLVGSLKRVRERDGTLALAGVARPVQRVLSLTGMDKVFPIHPTVDEATSSLA
jgi:anti-sigma B factor antagonist